jgi:hypothetical protein
MSQELKLQAGDLGEGYCPENYQALYNDMFAKGRAILGADSTFIFQADEPGADDRDKVWVKVLDDETLDNIYAWNSNTGAWEAVVRRFLIAREKYASASGPSAPAAGVWTARLLNEQVSNNIPSAVLATGSGQISLPAGTYAVRASAPGGLCDGHQIKVRDLNGDNDYHGTACYSPAEVGTSVLSTKFTLTQAAVIELQHRVESLDGTHPEWAFGRPVNFGGNEVFAQIEIEKL